MTSLCTPRCIDQRPTIVKKAVLNEELFVMLLSTAQTLTVSDDATLQKPTQKSRERSQWALKQNLSDFTTQLYLTDNTPTAAAHTYAGLLEDLLAICRTSTINSDTKAVRAYWEMFSKVYQYNQDSTAQLQWFSGASEMGTWDCKQVI